MARSVTAVAWFRREDWPRLLEIFDDRERFAVDYDVWLSRIEQQIAQIEARGVSVRRVDVDPLALLAWCQRANRQVDSQARAAFAAERAMRSLDG